MIGNGPPDGRNGLLPDQGNDRLERSTSTGTETIVNAIARAQTDRRIRRDRINDLRIERHVAIELGDVAAAARLARQLDDLFVAESARLDDVWVRSLRRRGRCA